MKEKKFEQLGYYVKQVANTASKTFTDSITNIPNFERAMNGRSDCWELPALAREPKKKRIQERVDVYFNQINSRC